MPRGAGVVGRLHRRAHPVLGRCRTPAHRPGPVHAPHRRLPAGQPPAAGAARPRARRLPGRQHPDRQRRQRRARRLGAGAHRGSPRGPRLVHDGQRHAAARRHRRRRGGVLLALPRDQRPQRGAGQPDHHRLLPPAGLGDGVRAASPSSSPPSIEARPPASRWRTCRRPSPGCTTSSTGRSNGTRRQREVDDDLAADHATAHRRDVRRDRRQGRAGGQRSGRQGPDRDGALRAADRRRAQRQRAGVDAGGARRHRADRPPAARRPARRHSRCRTRCRRTPTA